AGPSAAPSSSGSGSGYPASRDPPRRRSRDSGRRAPVRKAPCELSFRLSGTQGRVHDIGPAVSPIAFTTGSYHYLVGVGWPTPLAPGPRALLVAAAQRLYRRLRGGRR